MTGLVGFGQEFSLAFDTIFAEGQRKYMESAVGVRPPVPRPAQEARRRVQVEGIPPTIAIEQRSSAHNPRSTVATTTEIYDYLRLLFARCGTPVILGPHEDEEGRHDHRSVRRRSPRRRSTQIVDEHA